VECSILLFPVFFVALLADSNYSVQVSASFPFRSCVSLPLTKYLSAGSGDLDNCNGITVDGEYAYIITHEFPLIPRCLKGEPFDDGESGRGNAPGAAPAEAPLTDTEASSPTTAGADII
jgi:YHYH protein